MGRRLRRLVGRVAFYVLVLIIVLYTVFPFYWAIASSLRTGSDLFSTALVPLHPAWSNYVAVFREQPFARNIGNSLFVAVSTVAVTQDMRTVPVAIALISGASAYELPWGNIMAASVIVTVQLIVLVLIFQRRIVSGLTAGAIKG